MSFSKIEKHAITRWMGEEKNTQDSWEIYILNTKLKGSTKREINNGNEFSNVSGTSRSSGKAKERGEKNELKILRKGHETEVKDRRILRFILN